MKPIDLKDLINGLITIVLISIALGQYTNLREFAKREGLKALQAGHSTPSFFPSGYDPMKGIRRYR